MTRPVESDRQVLTHRERRRVLDAVADCVMAEIRDPDPVWSDKVLAAFLPYYVAPHLNPHLSLVLFHGVVRERSAATSGCVSAGAAATAERLAGELLDRLVGDTAETGAVA